MFNVKHAAGGNFVVYTYAELESMTVRQLKREIARINKAYPPDKK